MYRLRQIVLHAGSVASPYAGEAALFARLRGISSTVCGFLRFQCYISTGDAYRGLKLAGIAQVDENEAV